jgi:hypothetical protein
MIWKMAIRASVRQQYMERWIGSRSRVATKVSQLAGIAGA